MRPLNATIRAATCAKAALPFDLVLRLAGVLGRNDPISFALKLTRSYNPGIWKALDDLGVGKLVVQAGRERDFANLYRANDASQPSKFGDCRGLVDAAETRTPEASAATPSIRPPGCCAARRRRPDALSGIRRQRREHRPPAKPRGRRQPAAPARTAATPDARRRTAPAGGLTQRQQKRRENSPPPSPSPIAPGATPVRTACARLPDVGAIGFGDSCEPSARRSTPIRLRPRVCRRARIARCSHGCESASNFDPNHDCYRALILLYVFLDVAGSILDAKTQ